MQEIEYRVNAEISAEHFIDFLFDLSPIEKSANINPNITLLILAQVIGSFSAGTTSGRIAVASKVTATINKA